MTFPSPPVRQAGGGAPECGRKRTILGRMHVGKRGEDASVVAKLGTQLATERDRDIGRGGSGFGGGWVGKDGLRQAPPPLLGFSPGVWSSGLHFLYETKSGLLHPKHFHPISLLAISAHPLSFVVTGGSHRAPTCLPQPAFAHPMLTGAPAKHPAMSGVSGVSVVASMKH